MESARLLIDVETITGRRNTLTTSPNANCQQIEFGVIKSFEGDDIDGGQQGYLKIMDQHGRVVPNDPELSISEYFNLSLNNSTIANETETVKLFVRHYRYGLKVVNFGPAGYRSRDLTFGARWSTSRRAEFCGQNFLVFQIKLISIFSGTIHTPIISSLVSHCGSDF
jgi:hypothetical protein